MGAPTAQVQSSQSSAPAGKNAGVSPSTPQPAGKGAGGLAQEIQNKTIAATSGQQSMGQPNTNSNVGRFGLVNPNPGKPASMGMPQDQLRPPPALAPNPGKPGLVNTTDNNGLNKPSFDGTNTTSYPNTVGIGQQIGGSMNTTGEPIGKVGSGGNSASGGKA